MDLPTEEFANDPSEVHALMFGFWDGIKDIDPRPGAERESMKESHYYKGAYLFADLVQLSVLIGLAVLGL